jgi:AAA domain
MAFMKPKPMQAALKVAIYGGPGSGKTFTSLLIAEGLAKMTGKRVAYVDTEHGTDFYMNEIPDRSTHPESFAEFIDVLYTRSITEVHREVQKLDPDVYCCVVIDSMTHMWESAKESYSGKRTKIGGIPLHAWAGIKRVYKNMEHFLLNSSFHVLELGREGVDYQDDAETGELKRVGFKMKAESETPYEPHILLRIQQTKPAKGNAIVTAYAEKDRTGVLAGKTIEWPCFDNIAAPILKTLGVSQAQIPSSDETRVTDIENLDAADAAKFDASVEILADYKALFQLAKSIDEVQELSKQLTPAVKAKLVPQHLAELRDAYRTAYNHAEQRQTVDETDEAQDCFGLEAENIHDRKKQEAN